MSLCMPDPNDPLSKSLRRSKLCILLGYAGLCIFALVILPLGIFMAYYFNGVNFTGPLPPSAHDENLAFFDAFVSIFLDKLIYCLLPPLIILIYGIRVSVKSKQ
jgi:hypothetical protein